MIISVRIRSSNYSLRNPNNLAHVRSNQTTFGSNSLMSIAPQIWNGLPDKIKSAENLKNFKDLINNGMVPIANVVPANDSQIRCN